MSNQRPSFEKKELALSASPYVYLPMDIPAYVVEIKRRREIPASIVDEVQAKIDRLPLRRGLSVRTALVYDGELAPSVVRRGWFDFLVPADTLLAP